MAVRVSELRNGAAKAGNGHARAALGSYGDLDDRMLVLDFQAGNDEAFAEIHRRYCGLARHVCQRILHNPDDADEATQEAMLRVYQGLARFNGRYALQPWVARIATNVSLDVTRAWARRPRRDDSVHDLDEDPGDHSEDPLADVPSQPAVPAVDLGERFLVAGLEVEDQHPVVEVSIGAEGRPGVAVPGLGGAVPELRNPYGHTSPNN